MIPARVTTMLEIATEENMAADTDNSFQLFIFYTIKTFGAVVFSIIMTIRILFSTILSCLVYSHNITELGLLGIAIVFGAVSYRIKMKTEGKPLIRWRETEESKQVFHEWHEHLDI